MKYKLNYFNCNKKHQYIVEDFQELMEILNKFIEDYVPFGYDDDLHSVEEIQKWIEEVNGVFDFEMSLETTKVLDNQISMFDMKVGDDE